MSQFEFTPEKTYEFLLKQANGMALLIRGLEKKKAFQHVSMAQMARELAMQGYEEINAQRDINEKLTNEIMALEAERDALKAERDDIQARLDAELANGWQGKWHKAIQCGAAVERQRDDLRAELEALKAELEAARKQEPVGYFYLLDFSDTTIYQDKLGDENFAPLYAERY